VTPQVQLLLLLLVLLLLLTCLLLLLLAVQLQLLLKPQVLQVLLLRHLLRLRERLQALLRPVPAAAAAAVGAAEHASRAMLLPLAAARVMARGCGRAGENRSTQPVACFWLQWQSSEGRELQQKAICIT
jgi:hypothetical protein